MPIALARLDQSKLKYFFSLKSRDVSTVLDEVKDLRKFRLFTQ